MGKEAWSEAIREAEEVEVGCSRVERRKSVIICSSRSGLALSAPWSVCTCGNIAI